MKGFKKLALVTAIAAAPFAQAELTSIDDSVLSEMTGQAGVTIELDTALTIGSLTYTDGDGDLVRGAGTEGNVVLSNIAFGGSTVAGSTNLGADARFDDIKIDIDVDGDDGIKIHLIGTDTLSALIGTNSADFGLTVGAVSSNALGGNLASNIAIAGNLGPVDIVIDGDGADAANDLINIKAYFEVTSGSLDVDVIGLGITDLKIGQDSSPILAASSAYRAEIAGVDAVAAQLTTAAPLIALNGSNAYNKVVADAGTAAFDGWVQDDAVGAVVGEDVDGNTAADLQATAEAAPATLLLASGTQSATEEATRIGVMQATINAAPGSQAGTAASDAIVNADAIADERLVVGTAAFDGWVQDPAVGAVVGEDADGKTAAVLQSDAEGVYDLDATAQSDAVVAAKTAAYNTAADPINALANPNNALNMAFAEISIGNGSTSYYDLAAGELVTVDNVLTVDISSFNIDVSMGLTLGSIDGVAQSIGHIAIQDLDMSGTKLKIYGH